MLFLKESQKMLNEEWRTVSLDHAFMVSNYGNDMSKSQPNTWINWICQSCGEKYCNGPQYSVSTWHMDTCDICGEETECTEPRDFGYLRNEFMQNGPL